MAVGTENLEVMSGAKNYNAYLLDLARSVAKSGEKIVDFGAGIGTFAIPLASEYEITCVEPAKDARLRLANAGMDVVDNLSDVRQESVSAIYSFNVLEHIQDDVEVIREMREVMRPGGKLLLYVPAFQLLFSSMDRRVGHVRRYKKADLVLKLKTNGFTVLESRYIDSLGFFASLLFRIIGNNEGQINEGALIFYDRVLFPISRVLDRLLGSYIGKNLLVVAVKS